MIILDSCCGDGQSTKHFSTIHNNYVIGVDKSGYRLKPYIGPQYALIRSDIRSVWELLMRRSVALERHYLLYPCPKKDLWYKEADLIRELGGIFELRTNNLEYAIAFQEELGGEIEKIYSPPISVNDGKYEDRWRLVTDID